jgi:23S rRNA pseudouridine1911/1915/1917 synthase
MEELLKKVAVIFESEGVTVINKPAGLVVHSDGRTEEPNLCDWVLEKYPEAEGVGEPIEKKNGDVIARPGIVHRLDRDTSGALIIARTNEAHTHLKQQFKNREIEKEYATFVHGRIEAMRFEINDPIGRSVGDFRRWSVPPHVRGKVRSAHTDFKTILTGEKATYLQAFPKTGRTHQIRVHLKSLHHPVVADELYAPGFQPILGFSRQALHARAITFMLPDGTIIVAEADLPGDFLAAKKELESQR